MSQENEQTIKRFWDFWDKPIEDIIDAVIKEGEPNADAHLYRRLGDYVEQNREHAEKWIAAKIEALNTPTSDEKPNENEQARKQVVLFILSERSRNVKHANAYVEQNAALLKKLADQTEEPMALHHYGIIWVRQQSSYLVENPYAAKAIKKGHSGALYTKAFCYRGDGDYKTATTYYHLAANAGNVEALIFLGSCYRNGDNVTQNNKFALNYYRQAAEKGCVTALYTLGTIYEEGTLGVRTDPKQALSFYHVAADMDHSPALEKLGNLYYEGRYVEQNYSAACIYYERRLTTGSLLTPIPADLHFKLGRIYQFGWGLQINQKDALESHLTAAKLSANSFSFGHLPNDLGQLYRAARALNELYRQKPHETSTKLISPLTFKTRLFEALEEIANEFITNKPSELIQFLQIHFDSWLHIKALFTPKTAQEIYSLMQNFSAAEKLILQNTTTLPTPLITLIQNYSQDPHFLTTNGNISDIPKDDEKHLMKTAKEGKETKHDTQGTPFWHSAETKEKPASEPIRSAMTASPK